MDDDYLAGQADGFIRIDGLKYRRNQLIGQGSFGPVYQGHYVTPMGNEVEVAIKHIQYTDGTELNINRNEELDLRRSSANKSNILHYFGYKKDNLNIYLITELCVGSLKTYVEGGYHGPAFHLAEKGMLRQVVNGIAYLHKILKTIHRDIKPVNLLIFVRHTKPEMKIADDHGLAKIFKTTDAVTDENLVSNKADCIGWKAPELYDEDDTIRDPTADIFSLGCVFGYLLTGGKHPFGDDPDERSEKIRLKTGQVILKRKDLIKVSFAPSADHALDLIESMVQMDPDDRPESVDQIANHFYLHPDTLRKQIRQNRKKETFDEFKAGAIQVYKGTYRYVGNLEYDEVNAIAHGSSGTVVYFGKFRVGEGIEVAIKRLKKKEDSRKEKPVVPDEFNIIKEVKHPNILHYIWFESDQKFMYIATERCAGTLQNYVEGDIGSIPRFEDGEMEILYQVTLGLDYLHDAKIVHRDIKPVNILISVINGRPQLKLADFGISRRQIEGQTGFINTVSGSSKGTQGWMAPELYDSDVYTFAVDVFSLGCVIGYLLTGGKHPFGDFASAQIKDKKPMLLKLEELKSIAHCDNATAFELIDRMVKMEPGDRPTVKEVLYDQFFTSIKQKIQQNLEIQAEISAATIEKSAAIEAALEKIRLSIGDSSSSSTDSKPEIKNPSYEEPNFETREFLRLCNESDELEDNYNDDFMAQFVELVTDRNVDLNGLDRDGWTPAEILYRKYKHDNLSVLLELLRENGAVEEA